MGLAQGVADLAEQIDRPPRRQGAVPLDQLRQAQASQVFHDIIVGSVLGPAIVVDLNGVGMGKGCSEADLALEPLQGRRPRFHAQADQLEAQGRFNN